MQPPLSALSSPSHHHSRAIRPLAIPQATSSSTSSSSSSYDEYIESHPPPQLPSKLSLELLQGQIQDQNEVIKWFKDSMKVIVNESLKYKEITEKCEKRLNLIETNCINRINVSLDFLKNSFIEIKNIINENEIKIKHIDTVQVPPNTAPTPIYIPIYRTALIQLRRESWIYSMQ